MELMGNVRVLARVRPINGRELQSGLGKEVLRSPLIGGKGGLSLLVNLLVYCFLVLTYQRFFLHTNDSRRRGCDNFGNPGGRQGSAGRRWGN